MDSFRDEWIAKRAYALWELSGGEHGSDGDHWNQAVRERDALERTKASADGSEVLVRFRLKPKPPALPEEADQKRRVC